jgi:hypothetical protein
MLQLTVIKLFNKKVIFVNIGISTKVLNHKQNLYSKTYLFKLTPNQLRCENSSLYVLSPQVTRTETKDPSR